MMHVSRFDHVGIVVEDLESALRLYVETMSGRFVGGGDNPEWGIRVVHLEYPSGSRIELLSPLRSDSSVSAFLTSRGEGLHHITFHVDSVPAADAALQAHGFRTTGLSTARSSWNEVYLRPQHTNGTLVQIASTDCPWPQEDADVTLEDVMAGRTHVVANKISRAAPSA